MFHRNEPVSVIFSAISSMIVRILGLNDGLSKAKEMLGKVDESLLDAEVSGVSEISTMRSDIRLLITMLPQSENWFQ